jgi:hypothetical protein
MRRTILLGILLFLGFAVAFMPAGLVRIAFDQIPGATLTHPAGTIWHGQGQILLYETPLGTLAWDLHPATLLSGALSYDLVLQDTGEGTRGGAGHHIAGSAQVGFNRSFALQASGRVSAELVNRFLAPYDMIISGDLNLTDAVLTGSEGRPETANGQVTWGGGQVRYILSGRSLASNLPPLVAYLGDGPEATVFAQDGQTPLIKAELLDNGFAKIGITRLLTKMLDNPWPGSAPDHVVVLEVEEQVF